MKKQKPLDQRLPDGTLTIRILPGSIAYRSIVGTLAAIKAGNWDGRAHIARPAIGRQKKNGKQRTACRGNAEK